MRLLVSAALALAIHGLLFGWGGSWLKTKAVVEPRPLSLSLELIQVPGPPARAEQGSTKLIPKAVMEPERPPSPPEKAKEEVKEEKKPKKVLEKDQTRPAGSRIRKPRTKEPSPLPTPNTPEVLPKDRVTSKPEQPDKPMAGDLPAAPQTPDEGPAGKRDTEPLSNLGKGTTPHKDEPAVPGGGESGPLKEAVPAYRKNPLPSYPLAARRRGHEGTVILSVLVDREGRVENLKVFQSSGHTALDEAALETVRTWLFEPAMRGERKIDMWVRVPVCFKLK